MKLLKSLNELPTTQRVLLVVVLLLAMLGLMRLLSWVFFVVIGFVGVAYLISKYAKKVKQWAFGEPEKPG